MATNIDIDRLDLTDDHRLRLVAIMVDLQEAIVESHNGGEDWPYVLAEVSFEDLLWLLRLSAAGEIVTQSHAADFPELDADQLIAQVHLTSLALMTEIQGRYDGRDPNGIF
jgi:hypothetical protein